MEKHFKEILQFHCPRWSELPDEDLFSSELVSYINRQLKILFDEDSSLTQTMIQNYVKLGYLPSPNGRKYNKEHLARLIVLSIYKQVIHISHIAKGVELQLQLLPIYLAYDEFAEALENALHRCFQPLTDKGRYTLEKIEADENQVGLLTISNAFALKLLGNYIIQMDGYKKVKKENLK